MSERLLASLRSLLAHKPSVHLFALIQAVINAEVDPVLREAGLDYAAAHLAGWPDRLRYVDISKEWPTFPMGEPKPSLALARWFEVGALPVDDSGGVVTGLRHLNHARGFRLADANWAVEDVQAFVESGAFPSLRSLSVHRAGYIDSWPKLLSGSPLLGQLEELGLHGCQMERVALADLLEQDLSAHLKSLSFSNSYLSDAGMSLMGEATSLSGLKTLSLHDDFFTPTGLEALSSSPHLTSLTSLDLSHNKFGDEGLCALADASLLGQLEVLRLRDCEIGVEGVQALAASPKPKALRTLDLGYNQLGSEGLKALASSSCMSLSSLSFPSNGFCGLDALDALGESPCGDGLDVLDLANNRLSIHGGVMFHRGFYASSLRELNLYGCQLEDTGIRVLARAPSMQHVEVLNLGNNQICEEGMEAFWRSEVWRSLFSLDLAQNSYGEKGMQALLSAPILSQLTSLVLGYPSDEAGVLLASSPRIANLHHLDLWLPGQSEESRLALGRSPHLHPVLCERIRREVASLKVLEARLALEGV